MGNNPTNLPAAAEGLADVVRKIRLRTPARLLVGRAGAAYRTQMQMELREAHAAARDTVRAELKIDEIFPSEFTREWRLFEVHTKAATKDEYLLRPDLGRSFDKISSSRIQERCAVDQDIQFTIGDGLSVSAVAAQVPELLPLLQAEARARNWTVGATLVIHHCRVGILNEIGELLRPRVVILLIGERPGLATAESLSAYMAYQPRAGHTDAHRNLISNIHARGLDPQSAARRILNLAAQMMATGHSGYLLREGPAALQSP